MVKRVIPTKEIMDDIRSGLGDVPHYGEASDLSDRIYGRVKKIAGGQGTVKRRTYRTAVRSAASN